ncbi:MAG: simple sugar transport system substrate-binding protein [Actinomycetota bacterium]|jgi:simple sugar transport system substrate-binding protein|nr:simple sugar transport system substrate-binding protein [Actinomycetota bacterium]
MKTQSKASIAGVLVLASALTACSKSSSGSTSSSGSAYPGDLTKGKHLTMYVEGLADPSSGFFRVLNNGAQQAGKDLGVTVKYVYPASVDLASYTQKIQETIAAKPDGILILGIGDLDAVAKDAKSKGIAVAFNPAPSVKDQPLRDPNDVYVSRVGADEYAAGQMAATRFASKGSKSMICVQEEVGDGTQTQRCAGMAQVAKANNAKYDHVAGDPDPGKTASIVEAYLRSHSDVDAVLATGQPATAGIVAAKQAVGKPLQTAGFDVSPDIVSMIQKGSLDFTMDQQGWWRGYMSVLEMVHYIRYGLVQANYFLTGPQIVDKSTADAVAGLATAGVR